MRSIARPLLWLFTTAIPVFIAACYGAQYDYSASGRVVDKTTQKGIGNLKVSCVLAGGDVEGEGYTMPGDGAFDIGYGNPCDTLLVEDVDGDGGGGRYASRTVPFEENLYVTIELVPEN